jgi:micrococcal nuclease
MRRLFTLVLAFMLLGAAGVAVQFSTQPTPPAKTQTKEQTVYITKTGKKYHTSTCRYLSKSKIPINLSDAKKNGFTACSVCKPPQ